MTPARRLGFRLERLGSDDGSGHDSGGDDNSGHGGGDD